MAQKVRQKAEDTTVSQQGDTSVSHTQREKLSSKSVPILHWDD